MEKIKVAIADDHHLVRQGVRLMVESFGEFEVIIDASNGKELIEKIAASAVKPKLALIDISMPVMNGIETMHYMARNNKRIRCIAVSMNTDFNSVFRMIDSGALAFLPKDVTPEFMRETMLEVMEKGESYSSFVIDSINEYKKNKNEVRRSLQEISVLLDALSAREKEFIVNCCSEDAYKEIAAQMDISPRTVDGFRESVFEKLGVKTRAGIVLFAVRSGLYAPKSVKA
jgi:DNA-binding NarL/FixJ family response regulator